MPSVATARKDFARYLKQVEKGEYVYITRHGRPVAAWMPVDVAKRFDRREDSALAKSTKRVLRGLRRGDRTRTVRDARDLI